jgi:hypothetical protein
MYMESNHKPGNLRSLALILAIISCVSVLVYLLASYKFFRIGFPLDDAWIHQTYARNLAATGKWVFLPGQVSGGSTSPLWTITLSMGYLLHIPFKIWTFGSGLLMLWGCGFLAEIIIRNQVVNYHPKFPWIGSLMIFEWHLTWAAVSGMETLMFTFLVMWILQSLLTEKPGFLGIGLFIGGIIWLRPDGILLLFPACLVAIINNSPNKQRSINLGKIIIGFGILFLSYLVFSHAVSGNPWPTTFYAKQAEYASLMNLSIFYRFWRISTQLLIGVGCVLLPGFILAVVQAIRNRKWGILAITFWILGEIGLYAMRLPVTYQHGRYVIPCMYVFFIISCIGLVEDFQKVRQAGRWFLSITWKLSIGIILIAFWGYGALIYSKDVAFIESEMVATSNWIAKNIPSESLIAAHDIGALGYFGDHEIIDLAGLITPELIPILRDETRLREYLQVHKVDYLMVFPDWYSDLTRGLPIIYSTGGRFAPSMGGTNMVLYRWLN